MKIKEIMKDLRENIEKTANVKALFGTERKLDGKSIIPVASVRMKGGGGGTGTAGDSDKKKDTESETEEEEKEGKKKVHHPTATGQGGGMGLDVEANPVGFIQVKDDNAVFTEIIDKSKIILKTIKIFGVVLILMSIKRFFRRRKKKYLKRI